MFAYRNSLYFIPLFDIALMGITFIRLSVITRKWKENCVPMHFGKVIMGGSFVYLFIPNQSLGFGDRLALFLSCSIIRPYSKV